MSIFEELNPIIERPGNESIGDVIRDAWSSVIAEMEYTSRAVENYRNDHDRTSQLGQDFGRRMNYLRDAGVVSVSGQNDNADIVMGMYEGDSLGGLHAGIDTKRNDAFLDELVSDSVVSSIDHKLAAQDAVAQAHRNMGSTNDPLERLAA